MLGSDAGGARGCRLEAPLAAPGPRDPRPPPGAVREACESAARPPDRGARPHRSLPEHLRPKPRRRVRPPARTVSELGGCPRRAPRPGRRRDQARRPRGDEGAADPGDPPPPAAPRRRAHARLAGRRAARRGARLPDGPPGCRAEDRRLRDDLRPRAPGDPGRYPRPPRRRTAGPLPRARLVRARARRDAADHRPRGRVRAPREPDRPRARDLPASTSLSRLRAAANVPVLEARARPAGDRGSGGWTRSIRAPARAGSEPMIDAKRPFAIFAVIAVICLVGIPAWAIWKRGSPSAAVQPISGSDKTAQRLFQTNCGACHTLAAAGTDGVVAPNLDVLLAAGPESKSVVDGNCARVLSAIDNGLNGRMPAGILQGGDAKRVANFVART